MYFSFIFIWLLQYMEATLTKSSPLWESSNNSAPKCKYLVSNVEARLTYWPLNDTFLTFNECDSPTFKLLNP